MPISGVDPNAGAISFADECAAKVDARVAAFVGGAYETAAALKAAHWGRLVPPAPKRAQGRARGLIDPDALLASLGTTHGDMIGDADGHAIASRYPMPDETGATRTVDREYGSEMFTWARQRAVRALAHRIRSGDVVPSGGTAGGICGVTGQVESSQPVPHALLSSILVDGDGRPLLHVRGDGMVYVSAMCTQGGIKFEDWAKYQTVVFEAFARKRNIDMASLVQHGQSPFNRRARGTYLHPELVVDLAARISFEFKFACMDVMNRYLTGRVTTEESKAAAAALAAAVLGEAEPPALKAERARSAALQASGDRARDELSRINNRILASEDNAACKIQAAAREVEDARDSVRRAHDAKQEMIGVADRLRDRVAELEARLAGRD